jgi:hypothetical protein
LVFDETVLTDLTTGADTKACKESVRKQARLLDNTPPYNSLADKIYRNLTRGWDDGSLRADTIQDFIQKSCTEGPLSRTFHTDLPRVFVNPNSISFDIAPIDRNGRKDFQQTFPGASGIISLSHVGFDPTLREAIVSTSFICGDLCGTGRRYILRKKRDRWVVIGKPIVWVSQHLPTAYAQLQFARSVPNAVTGGQVLVVALGIAESGEKHVLGVWQGATENTTVVEGLLEDLVDRGLDLQRRYLVVLDGSKALRAGVERVFGDLVEVQRCQIHKRRNVKEYLPENCQKDYDRRMRNAYAMSNYAEAKEALQKIFRQLERINPSAARSLEEGLEETLTVHRLGVGAVLRRKLATTNPIESCLSTVQRVARNVKRWREGNQPLRWTATGLLEAEKKFRRIKGYREILLLKERLNPSRIQQKEVRAV